MKQARAWMWMRRAARFVRARFAASGPAPPEIHERSRIVPPPGGTRTRSDDELARGEAGVDARWYLETYPDVAANGIDPVSHYLAYGWREGRDPRPDFSTAEYLAIYHEVAKAGQNPLIHYLRSGGAQGEAADLARGEAGVDAGWYLETYPDVAAKGIDPVNHYLAYGWREGRDPRPDFSTADYLAIYHEVAEAGLNPLIHYLRNGGAQTEAAADAGGPSQWHALWSKGFFYPKIGDPPPRPTGRFGAPGGRKILFVGHEATRTGAPLILLALMKQFEKLPGTELFLLLDDDGAVLEDYNRIAHVLINRNGALYRVLAGRLLSSLADPAPTLAICNSASSWQTMRELRRAGIRDIVGLIHERVTHYGAEVCSALRLNADRLVFPAQAVKAAAVEADPEFRHAHVISQGLLDPAFGQGDRQAARTEVRARLRLGPDTRIVLGCGVREPRKGFDLFLQLAARVIPQTPLSAHFVWLGGDERANEFTRFFYHDRAMLGLDGHVSVVAETAAPESYFLAADVYALTSRDDPFPCVVLEAMACALPVVAFAGAGGAHEALADGTGIVVRYLDLDAMARQVRVILEKPADFAAMGTRAQRRVRSVYRFADYTRRILDVCTELQPHLEHDPEKACLAPDAGWVPISRLREARGEPRPSA